MSRVLRPLTPLLAAILILLGLTVDAQSPAAARPALVSQTTESNWFAGEWQLTIDYLYVATADAHRFDIIPVTDANRTVIIKSVQALATDGRIQVNMQLADGTQAYLYLARLSDLSALLRREDTASL